MLSKVIFSAALASFADIFVSATDQRPDPSAPKITDLTYGPDVVATGSVFTVSLTALDPLGVQSITFMAYPNQGMWYPCPESTLFTLVNGTTFEGTWQAECPIPAGTPDQIYAFSYNAIDTESHSIYETFKDGFGVSGGPKAEYDAPTIVKVSTTDTVNAGDMLEVYLTLSDESGIETSLSYVNVHEQTGNFSPCASDGFVLDSGTNTDGVFKASCVLPEGTPNGDYWLEVHVYDVQHNPAQENIDNAFQVVNGATPDHMAPTISDMNYAEDPIERGQTLAVTATISDTGNAQSGMNYVNFEARESYTQELLCKGSMFLQNGDMAVGVWAFTCEVPMDAEIGYYTGAIYAFDNQNNQGMLSKGFSVAMPTMV